MRLLVFLPCLKLDWEGWRGFRDSMNTRSLFTTMASTGQRERGIGRLDSGDAPSLPFYNIGIILAGHTFVTVSI